MNVCMKREPRVGWEGAEGRVGGSVFKSHFGYHYEKITLRLRGTKLTERPRLIATVQKLFL